MINGNIFTHINFAFAAMSSSFEAIAGDSSDLTTQYAAVIGLKKTYPHLKVMLSFGGYSFTAPDSSTKTLFSSMVSSATNRAKFISSTIAFLRKYQFDGADIDWEYPSFTSQGGSPSDKPNFTLFLSDFRNAINAEARGPGVSKLLLTIASPCAPYILSGYELDKIHPHLDWINVMGYDLAGDWDGVTGFHTNIQALTSGVNYYLSNGIPPEKLVLGLATYGHSYTLKSTANNGPGAAISGAGKPSACTGEAGFISYFEIKQMIANGAAEVYHAPSKSVYCYLGDQWVGYDNAQSIREKTAYIKSQGLGGGMFWALDLDAPSGGFSELQCVVAQQLFASAETSLRPTQPGSNPTDSNPTTNETSTQGNQTTVTQTPTQPGVTFSLRNGASESKLVTPWLLIATAAFFAVLRVYKP